MKIRQRQGKWILRQVLERYVPRQLVERPKQGFDVPIDAWLREPLRDWAEAMLDPSRLAARGFAPAAIRATWSEHLSGARNHGETLWPVLMFQAWQERWPRLSGASQDAVPVTTIGHTGTGPQASGHNQRATTG